MKPIELGDSRIGPDEPTFVIAEAGSNHNGDLSNAKELIEVAADAGADAVKFQTFRSDEMYVSNSGTVEYLDDDRSINEIIEEMEMPYEWIPELQDYCDYSGIKFMSTPFDERSADELEEYVPAFKIASYTMSHLPFLKHVAAKGKPVIMSTGAHELSEIRESVEFLEQTGFEDLVLLQCVAAYPTPLESINVRVVEGFREEFKVLSGLSDHTLDPITAPSAAVALGASVVEKHFTLDKAMEGPDHEFALEPDELKTMVESIRKTERSMGGADKRVLEVERELHEFARRGLHAARNIAQGERLTRNDIDIVRPGERKRGLEPKYLDTVVGEKTTHNIKAGEPITWENVRR